MTQWYYAQADQRLGPVETGDLQARLAAGELNGDTLVWREGMPQWQPARELAGELAFSMPSGTQEAAPLEGSAPSEAASPYAAPQTTHFQHWVPSQGSEIVYAGLLKRCSAMIIDSVVLSVVASLILMAGGMLMAMGTAWSRDNISPTFVGVMLPALTVLLMLGSHIAYYTWMTASSTHATLGKMAVGIKVVSTQGEGLSLGRSFARLAAYLGLALVTCMLALPVSAFMSGLTTRKQALHDMVVDSLVVDTWAFTAHPERQRRELGAVTWVVLGIAVLGTLAYFGLIAIGVVAALASQH